MDVQESDRCHRELMEVKQPSAAGRARQLAELNWGIDSPKLEPRLQGSSSDPERVSEAC